MRYVAAYLLATLGGNEKPSADAIKQILGSVGIDVDDDRLNKVISELAGKSVEEVMAAGTAKLASVPSGGASAGGAAASGGDAPVEEAKKEEVKEESEEESDDDMGFDLFG